MAGSTGAPWNLPYIESSDAPKDMPATDRAQMMAVGQALTTTVKQSHGEQLADVFHGVADGSGLADSPQYEDAKATFTLDLASVVLVWFQARVSSDGEVKARVEVDGDTKYMHDWATSGDEWTTRSFMLPVYLSAGGHTVVVRVWRSSGSGASWRELNYGRQDAGTRLVVVRL